MLNMYPRHQLQLHASSAADGDENVDDGGYYNPFYAIAVVCISIFLFCLLTAYVGVWKALASAALAALLLGAAGCFAPKGWFRPSGRGARAEVVVVTVTSAASRRGYPCAQVDAPPAFAFRCPLEAGGGAGEAASSVVCSVCLEDVRGGEMVRQVPACRHVFHVGCIDMWLHSHRTCPMCRCVVSPPSQAATPKAAAEEPPESSAEDELPPV
ncbi:RING-H2 finger protein ATL75-like [Panicum miliaceum]|uniref:RING-type E3 ubiquitin transferase n=1 Tax=Panicum miliaceum TaxID=4540 RepID=A0A3L6QL87_PANMI|nr:RING-H2 finger protein ATL75-like [Panicum miliaceum]